MIFQEGDKHTYNKDKFDDSNLHFNESNFIEIWASVAMAQPLA